MGRAEGVVNTLGAFGKAAQTILHAQCADAVAPLGQDLVRITLVAHIPDDLVARGVEDRMQCDCQLDHSQTRPEMPAGFGDSRDRLRS